MNIAGAKRVEVTGLSDKRMITLIFCGSALGDFLPPQIIYKGKTHRCHPKFKFPLDWDIAQSPKHWSTEKTMIKYIENIIIPYVKSRRIAIGDDSKSARPGNHGQF